MWLRSFSLPLFTGVRGRGILRSSRQPCGNTIYPIDALPWGLLFFYRCQRSKPTALEPRIYSYIERACNTHTGTILLRMRVTKPMLLYSSSGS